MDPPPYIPPPYAPSQQDYPPAQGSPPPQTTTTNTVVVQQPPATTQTTVVRFPDHPINYNCHICHTQQVTRIHHESSLLTWILVGFLCLFLMPFGLCPFALIPLCIPATKDVIHTCPNCKNQVGACRRFS